MYHVVTLLHRLFAAGIQKCPNHVPLYQGWACLELRSGDVITAKRLIGEALTKDKRNGSGWLVAAKIEEKMGNLGLVGLILRRGIECAPGDVELYRALAEHEINRGKLDSVSIFVILYSSRTLCRDFQVHLLSYLPQYLVLSFQQILRRENS